MATATVTITVLPALGPWWMCEPKPAVKPCPVRPSGFVPLSEYDADFKFPLASSRKPSKVRRNSDCVACGPGPIPEPPAPDPVDPPAPPEPECDVFAGENAWSTDGDGRMIKLIPAYISNLPEDLQPQMSYMIYVDFTGSLTEDNYYEGSRYFWDESRHYWEFSDGPEPPYMNNVGDGSIASQYGYSCFGWESVMPS